VKTLLGSVSTPAVMRGAGTCGAAVAAAGWPRGADETCAKSLHCQAFLPADGINTFPGVAIFSSDNQIVDL
jgi:hypothetical protein